MQGQVRGTYNCGDSGTRLLALLKRECYLDSAAALPAQPLQQKSLRCCPGRSSILTRRLSSWVATSYSLWWLPLCHKCLAAGAQHLCTVVAYPAGKGLGGVWALKLGFARDKIAVVDQVSARLSLLHPLGLCLLLTVSTCSINCARHVIMQMLWLS